MKALAQLRRLGAVAAIALASLLSGLGSIVGTAPAVAGAAAIAGSLALAPSDARADAIGNATENSLIDWFLRGQTYTPPATVYIQLATAAGSDAACGTEVSGGSYARASIASSLTNWAGTQSAGSTTASSGTGGTTSNNIAVNFATPSAGWGNVVEFCGMSALTGGVLLFRNALTVAKTINSGDTVSFPIGSITFQIDN